MNKEFQEKVLYPELSYRIYGLCYEAHNRLGRYLNEKQYADFLEQLFKVNNINYVREKPLPPSFVGEKERRNIPDFVDLVDRFVQSLQFTSRHGDASIGNRTSTERPSQQGPS